MHIAHPEAPALDVAVAGAVTRKSGNGFVWDTTRSGVDLTPLRAATAAWWAHRSRNVDYDVADSFY